MALFFLLVIIFFPQKFWFCITFCFDKKTMLSKIKFFNIFLIFHRQLKLKGVQLVDKNNNEAKLFSQPKIFNLKKALKLTALSILIIGSFQRSYGCYIFNPLNIFTVDILGKKTAVYLQNDPKYKIIDIKGIFYTSIANIIIRIIFDLGVFLWMQLKIKLKKS